MGLYSARLMQLPKIKSMTMSSKFESVQIWQRAKHNTGALAKPW
jgi:hypothetical protein